MSKKELRNFCIKHNLPFTVEFKEPWYPKPIEIPLEDTNNTRRMIEILKQVLINKIKLKKY